MHFGSFDWEDCLHSIFVLYLASRLYATLVMKAFVPSIADSAGAVKLYTHGKRLLMVMKSRNKLTSFMTFAWLVASGKNWPNS